MNLVAIEGPKQNHPALLPCQFCGGGAKLWGSTDTEWIQCSTCSAVSDVYGVDSEEAVPAWNKRALKPTPAAEAWLREQLHCFRYWCASSNLDPYPKTIAIRDWLEAFLGESAATDPFKERRGK